jgi:heptosyltransferase-2
LKTSRVVVAPNWLGDCVMALPVLRAIRRAHPGDPLAVLAPRGPATLFHAESSADTVLIRSGLLGDARRLRSGHFDEAWLLPNSFRSAVAPWLAGIPARIGYDTDRRGALLTRRVAVPPRTGHQLRDYDALLRSGGIEPDPGTPRLVLDPELLRQAEATLEGAGLLRGRHLALLAPGAAFGWTKRWPAENFGALARLLSERGVLCAIAIGPGEEALAGRVIAGARSPLPILARDLDPIGLAALLGSATIVVANDSGPAHLASAVGTPSVVFFGPTDPRRTSPSGAPTVAIDRYVFCSPCYLKKCPYAHECMREITPEMALEAVEGLIGLNE